MALPRSPDNRIIPAFTRYYIGSVARLARLVEADYRKTARWGQGESRPRQVAATRMCRLLLWGAIDWPDKAAVHWEEMRISPAGVMDRNPFQLSPTIHFPFGSPKDTNALIRHVMEYLGLEVKTQFGQLLGIPHRYRYQYIWEWERGIRMPGPRYLVRMLGLMLMEWRGYPVEDMWQIDWDLGGVDWSFDKASLAAKPLLANPLDWLSRAGAPQKRRPSLALYRAPRPISMTAHA